MQRVWIIGLFGLVLATGCRNDCQQLCAEMRDIATEDCGIEVTQEDFRECIKDHRRGQLRQAAREVEGQSTGDRLDACERGLDNIRDEITCDELEESFGPSSQSSDSGSGG